jgi:hypothetical protein
MHPRKSPQNLEHILQRRRRLAGDNRDPQWIFRQRFFASRREQSFLLQFLKQLLKRRLQRALAERLQTRCIQLIPPALWIDGHAPADQNFDSIARLKFQFRRLRAKHHAIDARIGIFQSKIQMPG